MASLADHLVNIRYMREQLKERGAGEDPGLVDGLLGRLLIQKFTQECAATMFSHYDEIAALVPADDLAVAEKKLQEQMEVPPEIDEVIQSIVEALRSSRR